MKPKSLGLSPGALPDWPRLMREAMAATYLSISGSMLRERGPQPKHIGRAAEWDRSDLDRRADALDGQPLDTPERQSEADDIARRVKDRIAGRDPPPRQARP